MGASSAVFAGEQIVEVPGPNGPLRGSLLFPPGSTAAVLIVPGSGPTDRDGNNPLGVAAAPYRLLAEGLAAEGVATLRIDKRGLFGSAAAIPDADAVTIEDYAADVRAWAGFLRERAGTACVWLLGHSEGGLVALSARPRKGICGLILVATAGRPMGQVLRDQLEANPANAPILEQAYSAIASLEAGRRVETSTLHPALASLFRPQVQGFLIDNLARDPAESLAAWDGRRVLILQGLQDIQVGRSDAERLHASAPGATLVLVPNANHVLKAVPDGDLAANVARYAAPDVPLAPGIVAPIAAFVAASKKAD